MIIYAIIGTVILMISTYFIVRHPSTMSRLIKQAMIRSIIAMSLIVLVNLTGAIIGIHIPINLFTVLIVSIFHLFGIGMIIGLQWIIF